MNMFRAYKEIIIRVNLTEHPAGYEPFIILTKYSGASMTEMKLAHTLGDSIDAPEKAFSLAMDYAKAAIDGEVSGVDLNLLWW
jgi:hypothetical protein